MPGSGGVIPDVVSLDYRAVLPDHAAVPDLQTELETLLRHAVASTLGDEYADADPLIAPAKDAKFGDYQANLAMGLAKHLGQKPREIAQKIADAVPVGELIESVGVAGPGFINLRLSREAIDQHLVGLLADNRLGVPKAETSLTVVIDYASPNLAKEMHIGHLRSTIIGDAIARIFTLIGHTVVRQNHVGDWGTQFGMLLEHLIECREVKDFRDTTIHSMDTRGSHKRIRIGDLNLLYQRAKEHFDSDEDFADRARQRVVALQAGDQATIDWWRMLTDESQRHMDEIFERLGVLLIDDDVRPESFYNPKLADVIVELERAGELTQSEGAKVVFLDGFSDREGNRLPMIVQKSDGGYLYATTDLAALRFRVDELHADWIIYVVDARQSQHLSMLFQASHEAGFVDTHRVRLDHVAFGTILGKDRTPFKTREGETVKLADVLDEVEQRALKVISGKGTVADEQEQQRIAHVVGIGAIKYADLSNDRIKDYVFDWDRMLSLEGNTAPYLQNAYVRIRSIFRKAEAQGLESLGVETQTIHIDQPQERALALHLLQLPQVIAAVADALEPHRLCTYLYDLSSQFHRFYEHCPVLRAEDDATRDGRLALCELVARTLKQGLNLLGIEVVEQM